MVIAFIVGAWIVVIAHLPLFLAFSVNAVIVGAGIPIIASLGSIHTTLSVKEVGSATIFISAILGSVIAFSAIAVIIGAGI
jgi:hypothetical protein